ncbi:MAG: hypothetical protein LBJ12_02910 [Oscillospiraceae bacterium]|jgi:hypothetical protein|nr:hypothetical protein [Oscillospiraceae bacterium]
MVRSAFRYLRAFLSKGKAQRIFVLLFMLAILAGGIAAVVGVSQTVKRDIAARDGAIYLKSGIAYYRSAKKSKSQMLRYTPECKSVVSTNGQIWWFTAPSADGSSAFDLYSMRSGKAPKLREHGISNWLIGSADGNTVLFKKNSVSGAQELYFLTEKSKKSRKIAENAEEVWLPAHGDEFWYSKTQFGFKALWRGNLQGDTVMLENSVDFVTLAEGAKKTTPQLLYLRKMTDSTANTLCLLEQGSGTVTEIANGVESEQLANLLKEYTPGGNLYFFLQQGKKTTTWRDILKDKNAEADAALQEPKREDYFNLLGLWSPGYDLAMQKYEEKLVRDRIRHALDELEGEKGFFPARHMLCVWDGKNVSDLCSVAEGSILAKRQNGTPGVAAVLREPQATNTDVVDYATRAKGEDIADVVTDARKELVAALGKERLCLVVPSSKGTQFSELDSEYKKANTTFCFSSEGMSLYGIVERKIKLAEGETTRQDIYVQEIEGKILSPRKAVQIDAQQTRILGDAIWCVLPSADGKALGELHRIQNGKKEKIAEYVLDYKGDEKTGVCIFHHPVALESGEAPQAHLSLWQKEKTVQVDTENIVLTDSVRSFGYGGIVYIVPHAGKSGGTLRLWKRGKSQDLSSEVEKVLVF